MTRSLNQVMLSTNRNKTVRLSTLCMLKQFQKEGQTTLDYEKLPKASDIFSWLSSGL